jgi:spore coat-associated protein N
MFKKLAATLALLSAAAAVAGLGTYATFTSTTSATQSALTTGVVQIALGAVGPANRLTLGASSILPGDTMQRAVDLQNTASAGNDALASITLTTTASPSSALDTDATNGLHMTIDKCSNAWTESGTSPAFTYTCSGTTSTVLANSPVIGSNLALSNLASLASATTDHLRVTLSLPTSAPNSMQNISDQLTFSFTGTQRAGTSK